ncbi:protein Abitram isoform X2 [Macrosteles quadrilineatus]|uniref:protein Abitram isoform X2 n=1 Tax=Macrosteles quadrilineatus TaxID=74068 RepID=UPI0023E1749A|nr:protein Abitram isoform X2 [Macrosteles quadrilineatus]
MQNTSKDTPPIEESYDKEIEELSLVERYYTPRYRVNFEQQGDDFCVLFHSNRICVISLAPSHTVLTEHKQVSKIIYHVSPNVDRLNNTVSGKGKRGAQILTPSSVIFYLNCSDGSQYAVRSCVPGKLVEINDQLVENPNLVTERPSDRGYLAVVLPTIPASGRYKEELLTPEQYLSRDT